MQRPYGRSAPGLPEQEATSEAHVPAQQAPARQAPRLPSPDVDARRSADRQGTPSSRPPAPVRLIGRLGDRRSFERLRREGVRASSGPITVVHRPVDGDVALVAYAVGRRVGPAVVRNRVRRRLRAQLAVGGAGGAAVRPGDYLVIVRPAAAEASSEDLRRWLDRVLDNLDKKVAA